MKVGFIQFTPVFGQIEANLAKAAALLQKVDAELVVLPELFSTGYLFTSQTEASRLAEEIPSGRTTAALAAIARQRQIHIVAGICEREGEQLFNTAVLLAPDGYVGRYRKIHLYQEEKRWFQPGDEGFKVFDIGLCRLGLMICFDWFFPEAARVLALQGAQVICHSANLVLPFCQAGMVTRCLENRIFAVTANRTGAEKRGGKELLFTGKSQITGPQGQILYSAGHAAEEVGSVEIDLREADDKHLNSYNNLLLDRQIAFYGDLLKPPASS